MERLNFIKCNTLILFLFFTQVTFCQLSNFTLTVTKTDETCTANGALAFSVSNTIAGASILYTIFKSPNFSVPISVQSTNSLSGLTSGTYRVVATQLSGNQSGIQQQDITIQNQIIPLTYQVVGSNEICGNDGKITITITSGTAVNYELFAGPVIRPLQSSNVFANLPQGQYSIRVFDGCNEGVVQNFQIQKTIPNIEFTSFNFSLLDCNTILMESVIVKGTNSLLNDIVYPLHIEYTLFSPAGVSSTITQVLSQGNPSQQIAVQFPLYYQQNYLFNIKITDGCGNIFTKNNNLIHPEMSLGIGELHNGCALDLLVQPNFFIPPFTVSFLSAPPGFIPSNFNNIHPGPFTQSPAVYTTGYPPGSYTIQVTDACGHIATAQYTTQVPQPFFNINCENGCQIGEGSVWLNSPFFPYANVIITGAPSSYQNTLPQDVSYNIHNGDFYMNLLPAGTYTFQITHLCGEISSVNVTIQGYNVFDNGVQIIKNCNSFDISLNHQDNTLGTHFELQKWDSVSNQWIAVSNGFLLNNLTNLNFNYSGQFQIVKSFYVFPNGNSFVNGSILCKDVIYTFEYYGVPKINTIYSFACSNGNYDVLVDAVGSQPLSYNITTKNGLPFIVNNGNSNIFIGLEPGTYNFQVIDNCNNILNSVFQIPRSFDMSIKAENLCDGQLATLTAPSFGLLNYQWWKDNDTSTILSTTNILSFSPFSLINNSGTYHVRIRYLTNPNSCIDYTLDYVISPVFINPFAGIGTTVSYCGNKGVLDLFALLTGNYDTNGVWTETTNSGFLNANYWNSNLIYQGIYQFKYSVTKCSVVDQAIVNINIYNIPEKPDTNGIINSCEGNDVQLNANAEMPYAYSWTGPNNFVSTTQNPILTNATTINNGTYTVVANNGHCLSPEAEVILTINDVPNFTLNAKCNGASYMITATPLNNSFDVNTVSYSWTGSNGFTSSVNPVDITHLSPGTYTLTVTDGNGCDGIENIDISSTICEIPNAITPNNDGLNDSFNLSGLNVLKLEIYSRWGRKVYEKNGYIDEWHGQNSEGGILPDSTYYYIIELNTNEMKTGWIFLSKG